MDAPVGRTSKEAENGTLLIMVGGDAADVGRARPLLECMGDTIIHCGPRGTGIRTKLVNNYLSIVSNVVVAEALAIAEGAGLDRDKAIEVLMGTTAGRGHLATTYPAKVLAGDLEPGFMVDLALKDLHLALQMSSDSRSSRSMGTSALPFYEQQATGEWDAWTGLPSTTWSGTCQRRGVRRNPTTACQSPALSPRRREGWVFESARAPINSSPVPTYPNLVGPARSIEIMIATRRSFRIAARYSSQSGCSPESRR